MDIRCTKCGEPWDMDSLHDIAATEFEDHHHMTYREYRERRGVKAAQDAYDIFFQSVRKRWAKDGCEVFDTSHNQETMGGNTAKVSALVHEFMGDDIDGIASMTDDAQFLGVID